MEKSNQISISALNRRLTSISLAVKPKIYVWGALVKVQSRDNIFNLPYGFNEIRDVHMNQGSIIQPYSNQNAPWQDGGIIIEHNGGSNRSDSNRTGIFMRFSSQTFNVDGNGQPLSGSNTK